MPESTLLDDGVTELNEKKAATYEWMAVMNRSFEQIIRAIYELEEMNVVTLDYAVEQEIVANELWARGNCHILASVNHSELDDLNHFSRMVAHRARQAEKAKIAKAIKRRTAKRTKGSSG